jgi:hypothetical protein
MHFFNIDAIVHPLYEPGYVTPCAGNLTEETSVQVYLNLSLYSSYLNFPPAYEYPNYVENKIS